MPRPRLDGIEDPGHLAFVLSHRGAFGQRISYDQQLVRSQRADPDDAVEVDTLILVATCGESDRFLLAVGRSCARAASPIMTTTP
jgi:hypothetical protein